MHRFDEFDDAKEHGANANHTDWDYVDPTLPHGKTWKNNFYFGAIQTISERLTTNLQSLKVGNENINALVVSNDFELKEYMHKNFPRLGYSSFNYTRDSGGFNSGKAAGRSIQFRNGVGAGGSNGPKLIGGGK